MGLAELIQQFINTNLSKVHTVLPGVITEVYENGTDISVKPSVKPLTTGGNTELGIIHNVPYSCPQTPTKGIRWEPDVGDPVLLLVSEVSLDTYMEATADIVNAEDGTRFNLSDAIAIPGLLPIPKQVPIDPSVSLEIKTKEQSVTIKKSGDIQIGGDSATKLVTEAMKDHYTTHTHEVVEGLTGAPLLLTPPTIASFTTNKTKAE